MIVYGMEKPNTINPAFQLDRTPRGKFLPRILRDSLGRRMIVMDLREVERRLKARSSENAEE